MEHDFSVAGYIARCKIQRDTGTLQALVYAALELRLGVETRMAEIIAQIEGLSKAERKKWSIPDLNKTIENEFQSGDTFLILTYLFEDPEEQLELKFFPVSKELQDIVMRLGDYLHRKARIELDPESALAELTAMVRQGFGLLTLANAGELVAMPHLDPEAGPSKLQLKLPIDDPRRALFRKGRRYRIDVAHFTPVSTATFVEADALQPDASGHRSAVVAVLDGKPAASGSALETPE